MKRILVFSDMSERAMNESWPAGTVCASPSHALSIVAVRYTSMRNVRVSQRRPSAHVHMQCGQQGAKAHEGRTDKQFAMDSLKVV